MSLNVVCINCSLTSSEHSSNTQVMVEDVVGHMRRYDPDLVFETVRVVDHRVMGGVTLDEGEGDEWPAIAEKILAADVECRPPRA